MNMDNYDKKERTISFLKATNYTMLFFLPALAPFIMLYLYFWDTFAPVAPPDNPILELAIDIGFITAGAIAHELIHGFMLSYFAPGGSKSIKYGFQWKSFTPYCHCSEPVKLHQYIISLIMPGLLLGVLPLLGGLFIGHRELFFFGIIFTLAGGGDAIIVWLLRNEKADTLVQDHPEKAGCIVYETSSGTTRIQ